MATAGAIAVGNLFCKRAGGNRSAGGGISKCVRGRHAAGACGFVTGDHERGGIHDAKAGREFLLAPCKGAKRSEFAHRRCGLHHGIPAARRRLFYRRFPRPAPHAHRGFIHPARSRIRGAGFKWPGRTEGKLCPSRSVLPPPRRRGRGHRPRMARAKARRPAHQRELSPRRHHRQARRAGFRLDGNAGRGHRPPLLIHRVCFHREKRR